MPLPLSSSNKVQGDVNSSAVGMSRLPLIVLLVATANVQPTRDPAVWTAGSGLVLRVAAFPTASKALRFRFDVNGSTWLSSADVMLRCGGTELRSRNGTLQAAAPAIGKGTDARLGSYEGVEQRWSPVAGAPAGCGSVSAVASCAAGGDGPASGIPF